MAETIRMIDIARACGVSLTTVSLTLNGKGTHYGVAAATQQRILDHVRKVGYVPNADAASIASGGTEQIGIVINSNADEMSENHKALLFNLLQRLHAKGKRPLIQVIDQDSIVEGFRFLAGKKTRDIVVIGYTCAELCLSSHELLPLLRSRRLLLVDYRFQPNDITPVDLRSCIRIGFARTLSLAAARQLLLDYGHRKIAMMPLALHYLEEAPPLPPGVCVYPLRDIGAEDQDAFTAGAQLAPEVMALMRDEGCTAVMMYDDMMAIGLLDALLNAGLRAPDDLSVLGFDNILASPYARVPLTTIEVPVREMVDTVCEELFGETPSMKRDYRLQGRVIRRASVGPAPVVAAHVS